MHLIEVYHLHLHGLAKQRQKKESKASDFKGADYEKLQTAILKEIINNLGTQAYEPLSREDSQRIELNKPEKIQIMESRYVITIKLLEPAEVSKAESEGVLLEDRSRGPCKAKCRHVMKGYSEESALEVEITTPQITRDSVIFTLQMLASSQWVPGFLDFTQAFHSGDWIQKGIVLSTTSRRHSWRSPGRITSSPKDLLQPYKWSTGVVQASCEEVENSRLRNQQS